MNNINLEESHNVKKNIAFFNRDNSQHKSDSYCCPYCTNLPEILSFNEGNNTIKFNCKKHGEKSLDIQDYLKKMKNYLSNSELNTKSRCSIHHENFSFFCFICKENICQKCLKNHENHIKYSIESLRPNDNELLLIKNKIDIYLQEKIQLTKKLKILEDKITFFDSVINSLEKQKPNYYLNINIKHLLYGEKINLDEIVKNFKQKLGILESETKKQEFKDFIKNKFLEATKGKDKLLLQDKNLGDSLITDLIKGLQDSTIFKILKLSGKNLNPKEIIGIKDIKILNLRGNKISKIDFLLNKDFISLEILSLNDNEIESIDNLKKISLPFLKELYLSKNKINSIDALSDFKSKKLQILWLSDNNISSIDSLGKANFPQLMKLGLNKNKIKDINIFKKVKFPQLFELYLNDNEFDVDDFYEVIEKLSSKIQEFYYS